MSYHSNPETLNPSPTVTKNLNEQDSRLRGYHLTPLTTGQGFLPPLPFEWGQLTDKPPAEWTGFRWPKWLPVGFSMGF
ncbi:hypothetical protein JTE90_011871 [Oedothorax gibbosus]|uniref:Uncharacterized protein n=1 Tax=Oedothorax gibbosus TaxID=931172 RepID=A0AAV6V347_9ARAC|nr:hypothetical protein JTE90_011871 [Oedothorax gibbosus]